MRRRKVFLLSILLVTLLLVACGDGRLTEENDNMKNNMRGESSDMAEGTLMTKEYIIEHGLATEEDLEGVDIDRMIIELDWKKGTEEGLNVAKLITTLKKDYLFEDSRPDYSWLTSDIEQEEKFAKKDIGQITVIGFEYNAGDFYTSMIFDFMKSKAYLGLSLYEKAEPAKEISLTGDQIKKIKEMLNNYALYEWDKKYEGIDDFDILDSNFMWNLYYALEDGRIYSNSGSGGFGNNAPNNWNELRDGFEAFWE